MKRIIIYVLLVVITGCGAVDSMTEGLKHSQEVADDMERSVGERPFVGFNWSNGFLTDVSVTFSVVPDEKSVNELIVLSRESIQKHFEQIPDQIIVAFSVGAVSK